MASKPISQPALESRIEPTANTAVIDPAAVQAVNETNSKTVALYFQHRDESDRLLKEYIALTGSAPKRPKLATAAVTEDEKSVILAAIKEALKDNKVVNLTAFGNIINKALAKADLEMKQPQKVAAIAEQLDKEGEINYTPSNGRLNPAQISLAQAAK